MCVGPIVYVYGILALQLNKIQMGLLMISKSGEKHKEWGEIVVSLSIKLKSEVAIQQGSGLAPYWVRLPPIMGQICDFLGSVSAKMYLNRS